MIRVWVIEDHSGIRNSLGALIGGTPGFECAVFGSMEAVLAQAAKGPDVALVDIGLPGMSGLEGIRCIKEKWPSASPVMLTIHDDDERIMEALCAGANGYLLKNTAPVRLLEAIRDSAGGGSPMSPEVARRVVELFRRIQPAPRTDCELTPHEVRVLNLLVGGESLRTAAEILHVSPNTVSYHVRHIYEKLQVHSRGEAVAKALQSGLLR